MMSEIQFMAMVPVCISQAKPFLDEARDYLESPHLLHVFRRFPEPIRFESKEYVQKVIVMGLMTRYN